jgi:hypothetical protein
MTEQRVSLQWAAICLNEIADEIEKGVSISDALMIQFSEHQANIQESIDRRKAFKRYLKMMIEACKDQKRFIAEEQARFETVLDKFEEKTKEIIEANPNIPFTDSLGKKVSVSRNGTPRLEVDFPLGSKSFGNIVDLEQASFFEVPSEYVQQVSFHTLDTKKLKDDLAAGHILKWARLQFGTQLRGL